LELIIHVILGEIGNGEVLVLLKGDHHGHSVVLIHAWMHSSGVTRTVCRVRLLILQRDLLRILVLEMWTAHVGGIWLGCVVLGLWSHSGVLVLVRTMLKWIVLE